MLALRKSADPAPTETIPFKPSRLFFFSITLIIPPVLAASNFAEGFVINSTFSILSAGIWSSVSMVGLPSTHTCGELFLNNIFPSTSTDTEGMIFRTSNPVPPAEVRLFSTLKIFLSIPNWSAGFSEMTVTLPNCFISGCITIFPTSLLKLLNLSSVLLPSLKEMLFVNGSNPTAVTTILKLSTCGSTSKLKSPFALVSIPEISESLNWPLFWSLNTAINCTDAASIPLLVFISSILPNILLSSILTEGISIPWGASLSTCAIDAVTIKWKETNKTPNFMILILMK